MTRRSRSGTDDHRTAGLVANALQRRFGSALRTCVWFGSRARGEGRPSSDLDLFAVIDGLPVDPVHRQREVRGCLLPILERLTAAVSIVALTPAEFEADLTPLLLDVCADGICVAGGDYFEPFRERAARAAEGADLVRRSRGGMTGWVFSRAPRPGWRLDWDGFREG